MVTWDFDPPMHLMSSCSESPHFSSANSSLPSHSIFSSNKDHTPPYRLLRSCLKCGATVQAGASHRFKANTDRYLMEGKQDYSPRILQFIENKNTSQSSQWLWLAHNTCGCTWRKGMCLPAPDSLSSPCQRWQAPQCRQGWTCLAGASSADENWRWRLRTS